MNRSTPGLPVHHQFPGVYSNLCPSSRWCRPVISSSVIPFSSCPQSLPASGSFPMGQLFGWGGQSTKVSASTSVLPMNIQDWSPLGGTGRISLQAYTWANTSLHNNIQGNYETKNNCIHAWLGQTLHIKVMPTICLQSNIIQKGFKKKKKKQINKIIQLLLLKILEQNQSTAPLPCRQHHQRGWQTWQTT